MRLLYYLSAIGTPRLDIKINILKNNLLHIYKNINSNFDIIINCYNEDDTQIEKEINQSVFPFLENIYIHKKKGILVELWYTNPHHKVLPNYDYILYNMDDVEFTNINILELIEIKNKYQIAFLSPKIIGSSHKYMNMHESNVLAFSKRIEIYTLLLSYKDFLKFLSINSIKNKHTWGVDKILGFLNIKSAICYKFESVHRLPSSSDPSKAMHEMTEYLKSYGFESEHDFERKHPEYIYEIIHI
jgi:hypothetical protein